MLIKNGGFIMYKSVPLDFEDFIFDLILSLIIIISAMFIYPLVNEIGVILLLILLFPFSEMSYFLYRVVNSPELTVRYRRMGLFKNKVFRYFLKVFYFVVLSVSLQNLYYSLIEERDLNEAEAFKESRMIISESDDRSEK